MKRYLVAAALFLSVLSYCLAEDTAASLQNDVDNARHQKNLGIGLTVAGGVVLAGTYVFYVVDLLQMGIKSDNSVDYGTSAQAETDLETWAGISLTGLCLGIAGLAVGIPNIIVGAIHQHHAQNALDAKNGNSDMSFEPVLTYRPASKDVVLGLNIRY
jgi:hypothetical protein